MPKPIIYVLVFMGVLSPLAVSLGFLIFVCDLTKLIRLKIKLAFSALWLLSLGAAVAAGYVAHIDLNNRHGVWWPSAIPGIFATFASVFFMWEALEID